jgi:hypothetical protein
MGRHIGKHVPGNPTIVVENMTGAGSLISANYTYNSAKPDGLFVGIWNSALVLRQALGDKAMRFDARKFGWIGAPTKGTPSCSIMAHTGLKSLKDVLAADREIKMGSTGPGSTYDDVPRILNQTIGTKFKVVSGYEGTSTILVAMRRKEIDGGCWGWESARTTARPMLDAKGDEKLIPFLIHRREPDPEVKDLPLIPEVIKGADNLSLLAMARTVNDLANRARSKKLQPDDVKGGTFTLTNHGISGSLFAFPVINQPQCGILGVGAMQKRVVVIDDAIAIRPMVYLSFVFDHRILDGASADWFLAKVKETLENWS